MRSLTNYVLVLVFFATSGLLAQTREPADKTGAPAPAGATKEEVNQLRGEVAAQRQTIEELKALVEKLVQEKTSSVANGAAEIMPVSDAPGAFCNRLTPLTLALLIWPTRSCGNQSSWKRHC